MFKYFEHPTVAARMKNDISNVKMELANVKELTGKDVTTTTGQFVNLPALWEEFMKQHLAEVERYGKDWLDAKIKIVEASYTAHMTELKKTQTKLQANSKQTGAAKQKYDSDRKTKTDQLGLDLKRKKALLEQAEKAFLDATKAKNLKEREMHLLWPQAVKILIANAKADQDQLAAYKVAVSKIKMPKAV